MADNEKLKEPGAGHQNIEIELAHVRESHRPREEREGSLEWLQSLRHPMVYEPRPCVMCGEKTLRRIAGDATVIGPKALGSHALAQCARCAQRVELHKLRQTVANPTVLPRIRDACLEAIHDLEAAQET